MIGILLPYILALVLGIIAGTLTGLIPGIHINLIAAMLLSLTVSQISEIHLITFIVALAVTHTFVDFIPSIFLGAASEDTITSILPGHKYLLTGNGYAAIKLTIIGSLIAILSLIVTVPLIILIIQTSYNLIEQMMGFILAVIIIFLLSTEKESRFLAITIFFLAGVIGTLAINASLEQPLFPLLTGLFGASTIMHSITTKTTIPKQVIKEPKLSKKDIIKPTILTMIVSPVCSLLPGLGASQAATISSKLSKEKSDKEYLILLGSINTLIITISFVTLYLIGKTRTGAASAIYELTTVTPQILATILGTIILTALIAYPLTIYIAKITAKKIQHINYNLISILILVSLTVLVFILSGFQGIIIYLTAGTLGIFTIKSGVTRSHLMGAILLPTTLYYLPFF